MPGQSELKATGSQRCVIRSAEALQSWVGRKNKSPFAGTFIGQLDLLCVQY
jgi:hypothetical protein